MAYVIVEITIHDAATYEQYRKLTPASIAAYGGRFVVRGGATTTLEGDWRPQRLVLLEFKDVATAQTWWDSPEYAPAKALRQTCADAKMIIVEGVIA